MTNFEDTLHSDNFLFSFSKRTVTTYLLGEFSDLSRTNVDSSFYNRTRRSVPNVSHKGAFS